VVFKAGRRLADPNTTAKSIGGSSRRGLTKGDIAPAFRRLEADLADSALRGSGRLGLIESVEAWITASLSRTAPTDIEIAAADFGMTARTFQRALAHHQVNYLEIRNTVRSHIAKCLLSETALPVTTIALQLGYSETSAFSRGFKLQVGETPIDFRRRAVGIVNLKEDRAEEGRLFER
jgi:AraC-like DNA-binding protein